MILPLIYIVDQRTRSDATRGILQTYSAGKFE